MTEITDFTLKIDYAFKRVFGSEENKNVLIDFLQSILNIEISDLSVLNPEIQKDALQDKSGVLDIKARLADESTVNVEIQLRWFDHYPLRTLYYWSKMYTDNFRAAENYDALKKCITINILNEPFKLNDSLHSVYRILELKSHRPLTDALEIHFLDLDKLRKKDTAGVNPKLLRWLEFIDTNNNEVRQMSAQSSEEMLQAYRTVETMIRTPQERELYESRRKLYLDMMALKSDGHKEGKAEGRVEGREEGKAEGIAEGKAEGKAEERMAVAKKLKERNFDAKTIIEITGLSIEEINAIP